MEGASEGLAEARAHHHGITDKQDWETEFLAPGSGLRKAFMQIQILLYVFGLDFFFCLSKHFKNARSKFTGIS